MFGKSLVKNKYRIVPFDSHLQYIAHRLPCVLEYAFSTMANWGKTNVEVTETESKLIVDNLYNYMKNRPILVEIQAGLRKKPYKIIACSRITH